MKNLFFKLLLPVLLFQFILIPAVSGQDSFPPKPTTDIYVQDHAGIMAPETEQTLQEIGYELDQKTTAQLVVVTVDSLGNNAIDDYANALFRNWGIGNKEKNNGVLLLIAPNERQARIEVGYGLEGALPDGKTGRIQDEYLLPKFKEGDYNGGILDCYLVLAGVIADEYGVTLTGDQGVSFPVSASSKLPSWFTILIAVGVIFLIYLDFRFLGGMITWALLSSLRRGGGGGGRGGGGGFGGGSSGGGGSSRSW